jgi:hypothetical protein
MNWRLSGIAAVWLLVAFLIYSFIKKGLIGDYFWDEHIWEVIAAVATWLVTLGIAFAFIQIRQARKSTNAQIALELFKELRSDEALKILRFIYGLNPKEPGIVYLADRYRVEYILDRFDVLAVLVRKGIIDPELAIDAYAGVTVLRCWYVLHSFVDEIRADRKYFGYNFEGFSNECIEYFDKRGIMVGFKGKYDTVEDLVKKLKDAKKDKDEIKKLYPRTWKEIKKLHKNKNKVGI